MECYDGKPIIFDALSADMNSRIPSSASDVLTKSFVVPQEYTNIMSPENALLAGTMFCDLYKPVYTAAPACKDND